VYALEALFSAYSSTYLPSRYVFFRASTLEFMLDVVTSSLAILAFDVAKPTRSLLVGFPPALTSKSQQKQIQWRFHRQALLYFFFVRFDMLPSLHCNTKVYLLTESALGKLRVLALWIQRSPQRRQKWKDVCRLQGLSDKYIEYGVSTSMLARGGITAWSKIA
jgi:hypothetical protein